MRLKTSTGALSWSHVPTTMLYNAEFTSTKSSAVDLPSCAALSIINRAVCEAKDVHLPARRPCCESLLSRCRCGTTIRPSDLLWVLPAVDDVRMPRWPPQWLKSGFLGTVTTLP